MKCKKCGNYIHELKCHVFTRDGADDDILIPIIHHKEKGSCYYIQAPLYCTMFEFDNYSEFSECITCPKCDKFPFEDGTSINTYDFSNVVFGQEIEKYILNGDKE